jgi:transcriptional regulator with XRE-family HTH domain
MSVVRILEVPALEKKLDKSQKNCYLLVAEERIMNIAERIKALREDRGLTQIELAQRAGISPQLLRLVEQSGRISNRSRRRIAWALGVSIAELGGLGPTREKTDAERKEEHNFRLAMGKIFEELIESDDVSNEEAKILSDQENWLGFLEVLWILKRHKVKLPKGIL